MYFFGLRIHMALLCILPSMIHIDTHEAQASLLIWSHAPIMPENQAEPFEEQNVGSRRRTSRVSLPIGEDGSIDWEGAKPGTRERFAELVSSDPTALEIFAESLKSETEAVPYAITEDHVKTFLTLYGIATSYIAPVVIEKRTRGRIKIPHDLASRVYAINDAQKDKLAPPGAQWANAHVPEKIRKLIAEIGPGAEFLGGLAMITYAQTQQVMREWEQMQKLSGPANTIPSSVAPPSPPPQQPVNGKEVTTASEPIEAETGFAVSIPEEEESEE